MLNFTATVEEKRLIYKKINLGFYKLGIKSSAGRVRYANQRLNTKVKSAMELTVPQLTALMYCLMEESQSYLEVE